MRELGSFVAVRLVAIFPLLSSAVLFAAASEGQVSYSPVSRVVQLLKALAEKVENDSKHEEDLYETYICWGKSVVSQKESSNAAANARIDRLNTYISDLENGRIELTTERVDLENEIAALTADIDQANALRTQEEKDFQAAKIEMDQAIDALTRALAVLRKGMGKNLLSVKSTVNGAALSATFAARMEEIHLLDKAADIGAKVLGPGDAKFLRSVLTADVPVKDWKRLNAGPKYHQKYEARSVKIERLLQKLLEDFSADLQEAKDKEDSAKKLHGTLMTSKGDQKSKAETALSTLDKENGARTMAKSDAEAERDALKTQVTDDTKYITETNDAMTAKKTEWTARKQLRQDELAAISRAIGILHADDARDLFKRSYASQGYLFIQDASAVTSKRRRGRSAAELLQQVARSTHDRRITGLAVVASSQHFDQVIQAIDTLVATLQSEESEELTKKETCESDRAQDTRIAIQTSREIDEVTDEITALLATIQEKKAEIAEKNASITGIDSQLAEAQTIRQRENADYLVAKQDDENAAKLVQNAMTVIESFYSQHAFFQRGAKSNDPVVTAAGKAPPPPPPTWTTEYKGAKEESTGIVAILQIIKDDIDADAASATKAEQEAVAAYGVTKAALEKEKSDLLGEISTLGGQVAGHETEVSSKKSDRRGKKTDLENTLKKIQDAKSYCDYMLVNYDARTKNRQIEIDGLQKAKAILQGATFAMLQTSRSFLQRAA